MAGKLGPVALKKLKEPENSIETWRQKVKNDPDNVRKLLEGPLPVSAVWPISARQALEEHEKKQRVASRLQKEKNIQRNEQRLDNDSSVAKRTLSWTALGVLVAYLALYLAYKSTSG